MKKVLICDDIEYMCLCFKSAFDELDDFEVVGIACKKSEVLIKVKETKPDIVLLDIQMDTAQSGIELIVPIKAVLPACKVIMLTVHEESGLIFKAISLGADNYILKSNSLDDIIDVVRKTADGKSVFEHTIARKVIEECNFLREKQASLLLVVNAISKLSRTEAEVVKLFCMGYTKKDVARIRVVEEVTVRSQVSKILQKVNYSHMSDFVNDIMAAGAVDILDTIGQSVAYKDGR